MSLLLALLVLGAPPASDPELVVVFERATTLSAAHNLLREVAPEASILDATFEPRILSAGSGAPPSPDRLDALFEGGAISVEVVRGAAQLQAIGFPMHGITVDSLEAHLAESFLDPTPYSVRVSVPGHWEPSRGPALFREVFGVEPHVSKSANQIRLRVPTEQALRIREHLAAQPGVVEVREA